MQIDIKIIGKNLFKSLSNKAKVKNGGFPDSFRHDLVDWSLTQKTADISVEDLLCSPDVPSVLVIEARDIALIEKIEAMENRVIAYVKANPDKALTLAPVIVAFGSHDLLSDVADFPDFISDWVYLPVSVEDLARRIFSALRRKSILKSRVRYGALTLVPESQTVAFEDRMQKLTQTEFALAELFLRQAGAVISIKDVVMLFQSAGKSTQANNIRVAIFQLRLKLEILTRCQSSLISVYKQGYCLRHKNPSMMIESDFEVAAA